MRILYAIQATGNGHLSRARHLLPHLDKLGHVDILLSGYQSELSLDQSVDFYKRGISFIFGKNGKVDVRATIRNIDFFEFARDVRKMDLSGYDVVLNDFEPVTAWACKFQNKMSIGLSHQASFFSPKSPRPPKRSLFGEFVLKYFAPCHHKIGFHFKSYDDFILPPVIRREILELSTCEKEVIVVYLPAIGDQFLATNLSRVRDFEFKVFSKFTERKYRYQNVEFIPVGLDSWLGWLAQAYGVIMGGGFEGPSEALFLKKRLLVLPMINQYEQLCNASALEALGVKVLYSLKNFSHEIKHWGHSATPLNITMEDPTPHVIERIQTLYQDQSVLVPGFS